MITTCLQSQLGSTNPGLWYLETRTRHAIFLVIMITMCISYMYLPVRVVITRLWFSVRQIRNWYKVVKRGANWYIGVCVLCILYVISFLSYLCQRFHLYFAESWKCQKPDLLSNGDSNGGLVLIVVHRQTDLGPLNL